VVRAQWEEHRRYGGVVPEIAARAHVECLDGIIAEAMREAGVAFADLDAVAVTAGPGLIGGLLVGVATAKAIALEHGLDFVAVNHLEAHALTVGLTEGLRPPYLLLLVSGGHTQLLVVHDVGRYERLGTTIDDALGEAFDKTAKLLGLGFPGGPAVEKAAVSGNPARFTLPRPLLGRSEPHFSFAGLKTAVRLQAQALAPLTDQDVADICAAFEAAVAASVADRVRRAMELADERLAGRGRHLVVAGGVAANQNLRGALAEVAIRAGYSLHVPPPALCTDNAAMVAWAGAERWMLGLTDGLDLEARARWPLDAAAIPALGAGRQGAKA
jgi:N6-L-threonylcarbamoyladenine synthase